MNEFSGETCLRHVAGRLSHDSFAINDEISGSQNVRAGSDQFPLAAPLISLRQRLGRCLKFRQYVDNVFQVHAGALCTLVNFLDNQGFVLMHPRLFLEIQ